MAPALAIIGSLLLAAALLAFAWTMQRRRSRNGATCDEPEDDAVVAWLPPIE
jgi:hypothetical protein